MRGRGFSRPRPGVPTGDALVAFAHFPSGWSSYARHQHHFVRHLRIFHCSGKHIWWRWGGRWCRRWFGWWNDSRWQWQRHDSTYWWWRAGWGWNGYCVSLFCWNLLIITYLLNSETSPLSLRHESVFWNQFGNILGDVNMSILVLIVLVFVWIVEIVRSGCHSVDDRGR